jgi:hypothetical protein
MLYGCIPLQYALGVGSLLLFLAALLLAFLMYRRPRNPDGA